jgi:RNA polymerase sigma-70 factor (ECF subfamily)
MLHDNQSDEELMALPDEELMALYQEGSQSAFNVLYSRYSGKVFNYLKTRCRTKEEAGDLFQEVFVKIHRSKHLYNPSLPVVPWIFSVTHSVLIDGKRKTGRKKEELGFNFDQIPTQHEKSEMNSHTLKPLIEKLPNQQQIAIEMRYFNEKTFEEIAERLKTSPLNVRQLISRGLKVLKGLTKEGDRS